jgi:RNA polymerase sigma factor (sigma-70 family)
VSSIQFSQLLSLIEGCRREDRQSQRLLYSNYYGYSMSIALRYSKDKEAAVEITNDSFMKIFVNGIQKYDEKNNTHEGYFKNWLKRIVINTALDYHKKNQKHYFHQDINDSELENIAYSEPPFAIDAMSYEEMLKLVKKLSPAYCTVFCLYVIDGYTHDEISKKLGISIGTSKSNLAKARIRLKEIIKKVDKDEYARYTG